MKKTVCVILALLCLPVFALAESAPSINTADMVTVTVETALNPSLPENSELTIIPVQNEDEALQNNTRSIRNCARRRSQSCLKASAKTRPMREHRVWKRTWRS